MPGATEQENGRLLPENQQIVSSAAEQEKSLLFSHPFIADSAKAKEEKIQLNLV